MYFNASEMKKMLKESWETNMLILSRKDDRILIQGNRWILATDIDLIPNKIRASIVELTGELPAEGYTFRSGKGQTNQYEFEQTVFWDELLNMETTYSAANKAERTRIAIYSKQFNLYRAMKAGAKTLLISERVLNMIDPGAIMETYEAPPEGPYHIKNFLYWTNHNVLFAHLTQRNKDDEVETEFLEQCDNMSLMEG